MFDSIVNLRSFAPALSSDPVDPSLRASVLANASTLASNLNIASSGLDAAVEGLHFDADANIADANIIGGELARVNLQLARARSGQQRPASLLDQRDLLLERLSGYTSITHFDCQRWTVAVSLGAIRRSASCRAARQALLSSTVAADGTLCFAVDGQTTDPGSGSLAGASLALTEIDATRSRLDKLANDLATTFNTAQAAGVDRTGAPGQPIFSGTSAATLKVVMQSGQGLATAAAGAPAGSRDPDQSRCPPRSRSPRSIRRRTSTPCCSTFRARSPAAR